MITNLLKLFKIFLNTLYIFLYYKLHNKNNNEIIMAICDELSKINTFYVKAIQWNIHSSFKLDNELEQYFKKFSSNVPFTNEDINLHIFYQIQSNIDKTNQELIFDSKPINSGTVAIVFKGTFNSKPVAIKCLRKNIYKTINSGIDDITFIFRIIIYICSFFTTVNNAFINIIYDNKKLLLEQCDLNNEFNNLKKFKDFFKDNEKIVIPHVYDEFKDFSSEVIVMDFLEGKYIHDLSKTEVDLYYETLQTFVFDTYVFHRTIHGDLHAGNMLFMLNNQIGIFDFGIVNTITKIQSNRILSIMISMYNNNSRLLINNLIQLICLSSKNVKEVSDLLYKNNSTLINGLFKDNENIKSQDILALLSILNTLDIQMDVNMSNIVLSLLSCISLLEKTSNNHPFAVTFKKYLKNNNLLV